jgi:iron complex transport system substrate-binding protein
MVSACEKQENQTGSKRGGESFMKRYISRLSLWGWMVVTALCLSGCHSNATKQTTRTVTKKEVPVEYAKGFAIFHEPDYTKVVVYNPWEKGKVLASFELVKGKPQKGQIAVPLDRVAIFSATQLDAMRKLGLLNKVIGVSDVKYLKNKEILKRYAEHKVTELYENGNFFVEKIVETQPHALFYSPFNAQQKMPAVLSSIPAIPFLDYMEPDPLGRAEWIKFTAVFFGKESQADSIFNRIKTEYLNLKALAAHVKYRPTVFSGKYYAGQWYVPGGDSYFAKIFRDAGGDYLWKDVPRQSSFPLDFEAVFKKAQNADFWRITGTFGVKASYAELANENQLFTKFNAFKKHHIIYCDPEKTAYFETSPLAPQILLADFIKAFHPELLPDYQPRYYKILP